ncbi:MAG: Glutamate dehydrogenase [Myxococcota bacterium]|nr:Glutamate dehydrogenase [Myxococcota bacterium]
MSEFVFERLSDEYGPEQVTYVYEPRVGLKGIVVVDNSASGPAIGGIRMAPDVTTTEVFRLARAMTWKNALAQIPHGGGKSAILADPSAPNKQALIRSFARAIANIKTYIPGPDMGTDETCMAWVRDEIGRSVGLSRVLGGIPLDQIGATGWGCAVAAEVACEFSGIKMEGAKITIQGFGNVGQHAARYLVKKGAVVVGVSDVDGALVNPEGLDIEELISHRRKHNNVTGYGKGKVLDRDAIIRVPCDLFVPAARPDVITEHNVALLQCKIVLQGANIPATALAERMMHAAGILSVPDFVCNAGGVICAAVEYAGGSQRQAFDQITEKISDNTREVLKLAAEHKQMPREAAVALAKQRVAEAMSYRRLG